MRQKYGDTNKKKKLFIIMQLKHKNNPLCSIFFSTCDILMLGGNDACKQALMITEEVLFLVSIDEKMTVMTELWRWVSSGTYIPI